MKKISIIIIIVSITRYMVFLQVDLMIDRPTLLSGLTLLNGFPFLV